ncbi:hypothetical protein [uncultured Dokdonia sp.]|uniref:hypothetical protein n=1 Tax=uncultured Dokdonia sp. TaxID=575653 RepID=UPI0026273081|nr:hypothetical protein [uncultured Dokdonia sp.]
MKLSEFINETIKENKNAEQQFIKETLEINLFKEKFIELIIDDFIVNLNSIVPSDNGYLEIKEIKKEISNYPLFLEYEIELNINHNIAQYYLEIIGNPEKKDDGVFLKMISVGYNRALEIEELDFDQIEDLDVEEYIVGLFQEFKKYD